MRKEFVALATSIIAVAIVFVVGFVACDAADSAERRVLIIADNNCDAGGVLWDIDSDVKAFKTTLGRGASDLTVVRGETVENMTEAIAKAFKDSDANDVNIVCLIGHGKEDEVKCGSDRLSAKAFRESLDKLPGRTAIFLSCCFGGDYARNVIKEGKGEEYASRRLSFITESNNTESCVGASHCWTSNEVHLNDINKDGELTLGEIYHGTKKEMYLYNRSNYIKGWRDPDSASEPQIFGIQSIAVAKCDEHPSVTHLTKIRDDFVACNKLLFDDKRTLRDAIKDVSSLLVA